MKFYGKRSGLSYGKKFILRAQDRAGNKTDFLIDNSTGRVYGNTSDPKSFHAVPQNDKNSPLGTQGGFLYKHAGEGQLGRGAAQFVLDENYVRGGVYDETGKTLIEDLNSFSADKTVPEGGGAGGYAPGQLGYGFYPANVEALFPKVKKSKYDPITSAPYQYTDPMEFAKKFGDFNRGEIDKNYDQASKIALKELDTELEGLQSFAPAAAALKRNETSLDNAFNQQQRTKQVDETLPGVREDLQRQTDRANAYAEGRAPDEVTDRALELGVRSAAADRAAGGGFGATSSVARKTSDLMSAEQRIQLSQYGDQLLTSNIGTKASLLMAPTEYSDAGSQIKVTPTLSGSQLAAASLSEINGQTMISAQNAFTGAVQQNQFSTSLEQGTRQFNASNQLQNRQFNASNQNAFALNKFQYQVGYAGAVAGAYQTNSNTEVALAQQAMASEVFQDYLKQTQSTNQTGSIAQAAAALVPAISSFVNSFSRSPNQSGTADSGGGYTGDAPVVSGPDVTPSEQPYQPTDVSTGEVINPTVDSSALAPGDSFTYPSSGEVPPPPEYAQSTSNEDSGAVTSFYRETGVDARLQNDPQSANTRAMLASGNTVLNTAGLSYELKPGYVSAGFDNQGRPMFSDPGIASSNDTSAGQHMLGSVGSLLKSTGAFSDPNSTALQRVGALSSDAALIAQLTAMQQSGNVKGFVNTLVSRFGPGIAKDIVAGPNGQVTQNQADNINTAFSAYSIFANWDRMSGAQQGLALASLGANAFRGTDGHKFADIPLITGRDSMPGLTVGQGLSLAMTGVNLANTVKNWDQMNTVNRVAAGTGTAADLVNTGRMLGLLGEAPNAAAVSANGVAQVNALVESGAAQAVPHMGSGAIALSEGTALPEGYVAVSTQGGTTIAAPSATASSTLGAIGGVAGAAAVAAGAYQVYKGWGQGGAKGRLNGAIGGASIAGGLYAMAGTLGPAGLANPYLLAGVVAASFISNAVKVGKSGSQSERDAVRGALKKNGLVDSEYNVTLSDGSKANVGIDGHGGYHQVADTSKLVEADRKRAGDHLNAWDVDYTNDMDYASGMGGTTLSRLISGGSANKIDQVGGQLGNAALGKVGFGKQMTQENFNSVMTNQRAMYAQAGIKSKADGYQLVNQMLSEKRINETEAVSMHQSLNMIFDKDGYKTAQKLMAGRFRGVEIAAQDAKEPQTKPVVNDTAVKATSQAATQAGIQPSTKPVPAKPMTGQNGNEMVMKLGAPRAINRGPKLSKEEVKARNQQMFSQAA